MNILMIYLQQSFYNNIWTIKRRNLEDKYITILDENNVDQLAEVIFTFPYNGENYVLLTPVSEFDEVESLEDDYTVFAYKYEELEDGTIGNLIEIPLENNEEWAIIEEMFNTFNDAEYNSDSDE